MKSWYVYILRCKDNTLYTGITNDIKKRYEIHRKGKGAKYTKIRGVDKIEIIFLLKNRSEASKIEYFIKKKNKKYKELLIKDNEIRKKFIKKIFFLYDIKIEEHVDK